MGVKYFGFTPIVIKIGDIMSNLSKIECALLLDTYDSLLTDKQRQIMRMYCDLDCSLAEIAEQLNISRQGVRDAIVCAEHNLVSAESKLHIIKDKQTVQKLLNQIRDLAIDNDSQSIINLLNNDNEE